MICVVKLTVRRGSWGLTREMEQEIIRSSTPVEDEINRKRIELASLENQLAEAELALVTFENQLRHFEEFYNAKVGIYLVELDELNARLAEAHAILSPTDEFLHQQARAAREQAQKSFNESSKEPENFEEDQPKVFQPSEDIKKIYRDLAKKVHPDLAKDEEDRERRNRFMQEVNKAYSEQDIERLKELLSDWLDFGVDDFSDRLELELKRINKLILNLKQKIREITQRRLILERSELGKFKTAYEEAQMSGVDIFSQIILDIQAKINHKLILIQKILDLINQQIQL